MAPPMNPATRPSAVVIALFMAPVFIRGSAKAIKAVEIER